MVNFFAYRPSQARTCFQTYRLNRPGSSLSSPPAKVFMQASFLLLVTFVLKSGQMRSQVLPSGIYCPGWPPSVGFLEKHKCKLGRWGKRAIFLPHFHHLSTQLSRNSISKRKKGGWWSFTYHPLFGTPPWKSPTYDISIPKSRSITT